MATNAQWTVVFDDKLVIKQSGDASGPYKINDDSFWSDSKWSNIWAIQYKADDHDYNDSVEYRDETPHATWTAADLGDFQTQFIDRWDAAHLANLQSDWDNNNVEGETSQQKIERIGDRPVDITLEE